MSYRALVLLPPNSNATIEEAERRLRAFFGKDSTEKRTVSVSRDGNQITLRIDDWSLYVTYSNESHVLQESREIAELFAAGRADREVIASCNARFNLYSDDDPNMDYFNDYLFVIQELEYFKGSITFDTYGGTFI